MKLSKMLVVLFTLLCVPTFSYSYDKANVSSNTYVYTPQKEEIQDLKVLVLFHNYINKSNPNFKKYNNFNFKQEAQSWEFSAEKENFFIIGFDLNDYSGMLRDEAFDAMNKKIVAEIDKLKQTYNKDDVKVYVAGTQYGAVIASIFNLRYDNFSGCLCMNCSKPTSLFQKNLKYAKDKKFYFFHAEKNPLMSINKINSLEKKLTKKGAIVEVVEYKGSTNSLPSSAYSEAIDKIKD